MFIMTLSRILQYLRYRLLRFIQRSDSYSNQGARCIVGVLRKIQLVVIPIEEVVHQQSLAVSVCRAAVSERTTILLS